MPQEGHDPQSTGSVQALRLDAQRVRTAAAAILNVEVAEGLRQYADELERQAERLEAGEASTQPSA